MTVVFTHLLSWARRPSGKLCHLFLYPDRVIRLVVQRTSGGRRTQQLLVAFGGFHSKVSPVFPEASHWLRVGVAFRHTLTRGERALMLRAHWTRSVSGSRSRLWPDARVTIPLRGFCYRVVIGHSVAGAVLHWACIVSLWTAALMPGI